MTLSTFFQKITTPSLSARKILLSIAEAVSFGFDTLYIDELLHQAITELTTEQLSYGKTDRQPASSETIYKN